jgi:hypothetical protein
MGNVVTGGNLECLFEQPIIKAAEEFVYVNKPLVDIYEEQVKALIAENIYLEKDIK